MPVKDIVALVLGLGIAIVMAVLATGIRDYSDKSMRWSSDPLADQ